MRITLPDLHQGRDGETQVYKLVNQLRRKSLESTSLALYQFTINGSGAGSLLDANPTWLAAADADKQVATDDDDMRGYPFASASGDDASNVDLNIQIFSADSIQVDSGVWQWVFTLYKDQVATTLTNTIRSDGGAGLFTSSATMTWENGAPVMIQVEGFQVSGLSTTAVLRAFITVNLRT